MSKKQPGNWSSMTRYSIDIQYKVSFFVPEKFVKSNIRQIGREKRVESWVEQTLISEKNLSDDTNFCVTVPCHSFILTIPYINFFIKKVECKETILVSIYFISHQSLCIKLFNASKTSWMLKRTQESATLDNSTRPFYQLYNLEGMQVDWNNVKDYLLQ